MKFAAAVLIIFVFILGAGRPAHAVPFTVVDDSIAVDAVDAAPGDTVCETATGNGICTLRAAIMEANALAGPDEITVPAGTYTITLSVGGSSEDVGVSGDFDITSDLSIIGAGADTTTLSGNGTDRVFHILSGTVAISGLTVTGGATSAEFALPPPRPGAGLFIEGGTVALDHIVVSDNHTGAGIFLGFGALEGGNGGGMAITGGTVTLRDSTIRDNTTGNGGPAISVSVPPPGGSGGHGGGVFVGGGDVTFLRVTLSDNTTGNGGTGAVESASPPTAGGSGGFGGGLYAQAGTLTLRNVTITGNTTGNGGTGGAGIMNGANGGFGGPGSGIAVTGTSVFTLNNVTITANKTGDGGSGGSAPTSGSPGSAGSGGGIYLTASLTIGNSIVAGNTTGASGTHPDCSGTVSSNGFNLIGDGDGCVGVTDGVDGDDVGPAGNPIDSLFDPAGLAENGGPTQTIGIQDISPAKNTGDNSICETTDQRGGARPLSGPGVCDKGAFELASCGDGAIQVGENCEDGDTAGGDGCSASCTVEPGFSCTGTPSVCTLNCGNGSVDSGEACDDGNDVAGDGCNAACAVEPGFTCTGSPSVCNPTGPGGGSGGGGGCALGSASASPFVGWPALFLVLAGGFLLRRRK